MKNKIIIGVWISVLLLTVFIVESFNDKQIPEEQHGVSIEETVEKNEIIQSEVTKYTYDLDLETSNFSLWTLGNPDPFQGKSIYLKSNNSWSYPIFLGNGYLDKNSISPEETEDDQVRYIYIETVSNGDSGDFSIFNSLGNMKHESLLDFLKQDSLEFSTATFAGFLRWENRTSLWVRIAPFVDVPARFNVLIDVEKGEIIEKKLLDQFNEETIWSEKDIKDILSWMARRTILERGKDGIVYSKWAEIEVETETKTGNVYTLHVYERLPNGDVIDRGRYSVNAVETTIRFIEN